MDKRNPLFFLLVCWDEKQNRTRGNQRDSHIVLTHADIKQVKKRKKQKIDIHYPVQCWIRFSFPPSSTMVSSDKRENFTYQVLSYLQKLRKHSKLLFWHLNITDC